ncbi:hypothetical protein AB1A65_15280 [Muricauda sp. ANG21]|uniref:TolB family protein n=1 Tax=Allomuricauda sp. ANG21 TaxID=3042468 RepID=UPI003456CCEF
MGTIRWFKGILVLMTFIWIGCREQNTIAQFQPGLISTEVVEYACTFSTSGDELYFARSEQEWGSRTMKSAIYHAVKTSGQWSIPQLAPFSGEFDDSDPHLSKDGNTLYFVSDRPGGNRPASADIWKVKKDQNGAWGTPIALPYPINSEQREYSPRTDDEGNLYFASDRSGGYGQGDLYVAQWSDGAFSEPENLGNILNSEMGEWNLEINGSGDLIIFEASGREENVSSYGDLYISFKEGGQWTVTQNLVELNTSGSDLYPYLTPDEKQLFYASSDSLQGKHTHIYVTDFEKLYRRYKR